MQVKTMTTCDCECDLLLLLQRERERKKQELQLVKGARVGEEFSGQAPHLFGRVFQGRRRLAAKQVNMRQEVVRTATRLQTRDQLKQDPQDPVPDHLFLPLTVSRMLLTLVQGEGLEDVAGDGIGRQVVQVSIPQRLQHGKCLLSSVGRHEQSILCFRKGQDPRISFHR